jgi:hypothetical protein
MGRLGATGMAAALCAGLVLATARADDGDGGDLRAMPPTRPSWFSGTPAAKDEPVSTKKVVPSDAPPPPRVVNNTATVQAREEAAYLRRLDVCYDLLDVAERKGDEALREQVYQLMDKAWAVYLRRTGNAPGRAADASALAQSAQPPADPSRQAAARDTAPWVRRGDQP